MTKEIEIPEGYEAKIVGNKVIIESKENEDERIRKSIVHLLQVGGYMSQEDKTKAFAWLEKQKEQKPAEIKVKALLAADRLASAEMTGRFKERSEILENPEKYGLQKSAEWSEEDEKMLRDVYESLYAYKCDIRGDCHPDQELLNQIEKEKQWIKSLHERINPKPHWKPSKEQMEAIHEANYRCRAYQFATHLTEIEIQLEKLMNE